MSQQLSRFFFLTGDKKYDCELHEQLLVNELFVGIMGLDTF